MKKTTKKTSKCKKSSTCKTPKNSSNKLTLPTSLNTGASMFWVNTLANTTHEDIMGLNLNQCFWDESDHKPIPSNEDEVRCGEMSCFDLDNNDVIDLIDFDGDSSLDQAYKV